MGPLKKRVLKVKQISCSPHASAQSNSFPFQGTRNFTPPQIQRDKPKDLEKRRRAETLFDRGVEYLFSMFILMPLMLSATTILGQTIVVYMNAATITCCRQTDISAMLQRVYWTSIFLYAVPLWITRAIMNQMVFVLNQRSGYILYPRWVAICLQIPAHLAPMALVALTCHARRMVRMPHNICGHLFPLLPSLLPSLSDPHDLESPQRSPSSLWRPCYDDDIFPGDPDRNVLASQAVARR